MVVSILGRIPYCCHDQYYHLHHTLATATTSIDITTTTTITATIIIARNKIMYLSVQIYSYMYAISVTHSTAVNLGIFLKTLAGRLVLT